jgi:hypothetical protein
MYHSLTCRLPVVRLHYAEDDTEILTVEPCGEDVFYTGRDGGAFYRFENDGSNDGPPDDMPKSWKVECVNGHVIFMSDDEGNEREIPFSHAEFLAACAELVEWTEA